MSCRYCTCADCSFDDTGAIRYPIGEASPEEANTIPRDQYELYKEAAEAWAREWSERTSLDGRDKWYRYCGVCERTSAPVTVSESAPGFCHTTDCKAARILGLKREE